MPSKPFDRQYGQALLDFIQGGGYPDSEIISAEVPSTAIPGILKQFKQAREDVKVRTMPVSMILKAKDFLSGQHQGYEQELCPRYRWLDFTS